MSTISYGYSRRLPLLYALFALITALLTQAASRDETWRDTARNRELPVKIRQPAGEGPFPVLLLSHGLGGSREGIAYLAEAMEKEGWLCINLQHPGSDESVWKDLPLLKRMQAMRTAMTNPQSALDRVHDIAFVIDELQRQNSVTGGPLSGKVAMGQIALAGHSFGAWTAFACAGRQTGGPRTGVLANRNIPMETRLRAIIALSPQGEPTLEAERQACSRIRIPTLSITGGNDSSPIQAEMTPERRVRPFKCLPAEAGSGYLIWFDNADHAVFNGPREGTARLAKNRNLTEDTAIRQAVCQAAVAFLRLELFADKEAGAPFLDPGRAKTLLSGLGHLETRPASPLLADARRLQADLATTGYQHGEQVMTWPVPGKGATIQGDCSGFINALLQRNAPDVFAALQERSAKGRPRAKDYYALLTSQNDKIKAISTLAEIQCGDIIAIAYPEDADSTGHVMLVNGLPTAIPAGSRGGNPGEHLWSLPIIDVTSSPHGTDDSRHGRQPEAGLGTGDFRIHTDTQGVITGFAWSPSTKSLFRKQEERPLVIGRPVY